MDESEAQSFIVRVWVEERAEGGGQGIWRGHSGLLGPLTKYTTLSPCEK